MKQTNVRCYTDLLLSILCVLLFSENNRQFGTYCFVIVKFPLVFFHRVKPGFPKQIQSIYLSYNTTLAVVIMYLLKGPSIEEIMN